MKKLIVLISCLVSATVAMAQYEAGLLVKPVNTVANDPVATTDKTLDFCLDNATGFEGIQFDMYVPEGIDVDASYFEKGSGLPYTSGRGGVTYNHTLGSGEKTSDMSGFKKYTVLIYSTKHDAFTASDIFSFYVGTSETVSDGFYPIYFKNIALCYVGQSTGDELACQMTYVKVGNPEKQTLQIEGVMSSVLNEALAAETAISKLDLTNVTASNGTFAYVPGRDVVAPETDVKGDVSATVAPAEGKTYATVCLPFAADVDCYTFDAVNGDYASFSAKPTLDANTPALVSKSVTATASNVALAAATTETKTTGYYVKCDDKSDYFCKVNGSATIPALRGWWDIAANVRGFVIDGEETAINAIDANEAETIYNVAGVRLNKAQRGVNIVNGKKVVIK